MKNPRNNYLRPHRFVEAIVKKSEGDPKVRLIKGYVGTTDNKGHARVYLDAELRRFVDIPEKGIVHIEDHRTENDDLGAVLIWVNEEIPIFHYGHLAADDDPSTMATGEEGGDPTTMATGEESSFPGDRIGNVINPFGRFI